MTFTINGGKVSQIESRILKSGNMKALEAFQEEYPTPNGTFDVAYFEGNWKGVLDAKDMKMTNKRHDMKAVAFVKLGQLNKAQKEAEQSSNKELAQKVVVLQEIKQNIEQISQKLDTAKKNQKRNKDDKDKRLNEEINKLKGQKRKQEKSFQKALNHLRYRPKGE